MVVFRRVRRRDSNLVPYSGGWNEFDGPDYSLVHRVSGLILSSPMAEVARNIVLM